jgi:hypothetical protein
MELSQDISSHRRISRPELAGGYDIISVIGTIQPNGSDRHQRDVLVN